MALIGRTIGNFRIVERLGSGGMGEVYRAVHVAIGSRVAIKVLHATSEAGEQAEARFLVEAQAVNRIDHDGVVKIMDAGRTVPDGRPYLIMELLDGESLASVLRRVPRPPLGTTCEIIESMLGVVEAAHAQNIVHRDLKPENIFLTRTGRTVVLDFGVAKLLEASAAVRLTLTGAIIGTPHYMAPEQIRAEAIDHRVDIYAVGCVLYEMLAGRRTFDSAHTAEVMQAHLERRPAPPRAVWPEIPEPLQAVTLTALAKRAELRFQTAGAMRQALASVIAALPPEAFAPIESLLLARAESPAVDQLGSPPSPMASASTPPEKQTLPTVPLQPPADAAATVAHRPAATLPGSAEPAATVAQRPSAQPLGAQLPAAETAATVAQRPVARPPGSQLPAAEPAAEPAPTVSQPPLAMPGAHRIDPGAAHQDPPAHVPPAAVEPAPAPSRPARRRGVVLVAVLVVAAGVALAVIASGKKGQSTTSARLRDAREKDSPGSASTAGSAGPAGSASAAAAAILDVGPSADEVADAIKFHCPTIDAPYFYTVEKAGKVSHLLGTFNSSIALAQFPDSVRDALGRAELVVLESTGDPSGYPAKFDLADEVGPQLWNKYRMLVGTSRADLVAHFPPPYAIVQMVELYRDPTSLLASQIAAEAKTHGTPVRGLESTTDVRAMFERVYDLRMFKTLVTYFDKREALRFEINIGFVHYCKGTVDAPGFEGDFALANGGYSREEVAAIREQLLFAPTARWVPELEKLFDRGRTFVAIDFNGLLGDRGLIALLKARGFKVTRVPR